MRSLPAAVLGGFLCLLLCRRAAGGCPYLQDAGSPGYGAALPPGHPPVSSKLHDTFNPFQGINKRMLSLYATNKMSIIDTLLDDQTPIIFKWGTNMMLWKGGRSPGAKNYTVDNMTPARYEYEKQVAHLTLATYAMLEPTLTVARQSNVPSNQNTPLDADNAAQIAAYADILEGNATAINTFIDANWQNANDRNRQRLLVSRTLDFLHSVLADSAVSADAVKHWASTVTPLFMESATIAVTKQLEVMHAQVMEWKQTVLSPAEWGKLLVVVWVSHQAMRDSADMQYFTRLLGTAEAAGTRVMYMTSDSGNVAASFGLLGTHRMDIGIGETFFDNPQRMHYDLLGPAASAVLDNILGRDHPVILSDLEDARCKKYYRGSNGACHCGKADVELTSAEFWFCALGFTVIGGVVVGLLAFRYGKKVGFGRRPANYHQALPADREMHDAFSVSDNASVDYEPPAVNSFGG